jgi:aminoglycoside 6'-N-acetyltransferase I
MEKAQAKDVVIQQIETGEAVPYELLLNADPSRELVDSYLGQSDVFVAMLSGETIGVYVLCPFDVGTVEIKNISVAEESQGVGLGQIMLQDAANRARAKGFEKIVVGTGNSSVGQLYLYQKMGFEITGIKFNFFSENYPDVLYENGIVVKHMIMLTQSLK